MRLYILLLMLVCLAEVRYCHGTSEGGQEGLVSRMDVLERLVTDQNQQMGLLHKLLQEQSQELAVQRKELMSQSQELTTQRQQISSQRFVISDLQILEQSQELAVQRKQLILQSQELTTQGKQLMLQSQELTTQRQQISSQRFVISDLQILVGHQRAEHAQLKSQLEETAQMCCGQKTNGGLTTTERVVTTHVDMDEVLAAISTSNTKIPEHSGLKEAVEESANAGTEFTGAISKRSDDGGPLEVVVSQLSQKVTQMSADIQSFKTQTASDIQALTSSNNQQTQDIQEAWTSTYIRWGNSHCGNQSELVYSGVLGGSSHADTGSVTNYLCLTMSPVSGPSNLNIGAHLYGGEYETLGVPQDHDPVCAVCRSPFPTTIMIPGTNVCTPGWHLQYTGFLMAGGAGHPAGSEFVCVDSALESIPHSDQNQNGKLLYYTSTSCGSLPCGPYVDGQSVTCAVCSK